LRNMAIVSALALMGTMAAAQEQAKVISSTPVIQQVAIPQQVCSNETIYNSNAQPSGAGAVLGALAGGAAGNTIGNGGGRAAATAVGIIGAPCSATQWKAMPIRRSRTCSAAPPKPVTKTAP